jgi:hypothetical protein
VSAARHGVRGLAGFPVAAVGADRWPNASTVRTSTRYRRPLRSPSSRTSGVATSRVRHCPPSSRHRTSYPAVFLGGAPPASPSAHDTRSAPSSVDTASRSGGAGLLLGAGSTTLSAAYRSTTTGLGLSSLSVSLLWESSVTRSVTTAVATSATTPSQVSTRFLVGTRAG